MDALPLSIVYRSDIVSLILVRDDGRRDWKISRKCIKNSVKMH